MINILSIDLEDYFMVSGFEARVKRADWHRYEPRIERNTFRLLEILNSQACPYVLDQGPNTGVKATFFCLGWIAERYPHIIKEIHSHGHEIACHSYDHQLIYRMEKEDFREDVRKSKKILENIIGDEVIGYRAPTYSVTRKSLWALQVLAEEGYRYDSSIFPIHHDRYGIPDAPRFPFFIDLNHGKDIQFIPGNNYFPAALDRKPLDGLFLIEFPISTASFFKFNFPLGGGGYFRLLPYWFIKRGLEGINRTGKQPFVFYLHPWEIDAGQPRLASKKSPGGFRHYANLDKTEAKFQKLLKDFEFSSFKKTIRF